MRITNKIISNNSVTNINNNKVLEDKLNTQLATGSKVTRPSDDPVVAIRALRLRTNLNQVNQYYTKNIPDANSWLDVTESAINTVLSIVEDMEANCTKGSVGFDTTEDRDKVLQNLKALQEEVYATGDADYAGRFVFGGYRTNTSVTFGKAVSNKPYSITEQLDRKAIDEITYVDVDKLNQLTETNAETLGTTAQDISSSNVFRIRLAYDNIDSGVTPTIQYSPDDSGTFTKSLNPMVMSETGYPLSSQADNDVTLDKTMGELLSLGDEETADFTVGDKPISVGSDTTVNEVINQMEAAGLEVDFDETSKQINISPKSGNTASDVAISTDNEKGKNFLAKLGIPATSDPYEAAKDEDAVIFIPETGELLLGKNVYEDLMNTRDVEGTDVNEGEIRISYQKSNWEAKDLRPEHYFYCEGTNDEGVNVTYNEKYLEATFDPTARTEDANQYISYDVGFNQTVRVNTLAKELFSTSLGRDIDDLIGSIEAVDAMEKNITSIKNKLAQDPNNADLKERLEAAEKANVMLNDKMQKLFESSISKMQEHHNLANNALTATGNRSARVQLVENRLAKQQTNFKTLSSENEDIDMAEVAVDLSSVELAYQAALMATGKISQTTLLNYL